MERKRLAVETARFKMDDDGPGSFVGYASVFGNVDRGGDRIERGAFADCLAGFLRDGFVALGHDWQGAPVAYPVEAVEDEYGLRVKAVFHTTPEAQAVRTMMRERLEAGKSVGLSIGFELDPTATRRQPDGVRSIERCAALFEFSVVTVPMNARAQAVAAKSYFATQLAERVTPTLWTLVDVLADAWRHCQDRARKADEIDAPFDLAAAWREELDDFTSRAMGLVAMDDDEEDEGPEEKALPSRVFHNLIQVRDFQRVGLSTDQHSETSLAVVKGFIARIKGLVALRTAERKEGRVLSNANRERLRKLRGTCGAAQTSLVDVLADVDDLLASTEPKTLADPVEVARLRAELLHSALGR